LKRKKGNSLVYLQQNTNEGLCMDEKYSRNTDFAT